MAIRWNSDKRYLRDLAGKGVNIIPTVWGENQSVAMAMQAHNMKKALLKPRSGASAEGIQIVSAEDVDGTLVLSSDYFMQPFMPQVRQGEYSLMFFRGNYAYTILKQPAEGSIFVQEEHGGVVRAIEPSALMIQQAQQVIEVAASQLGLPVTDLLYARVDALRDNDTLLLMELELIEPAIYLYLRDDAPMQFAQAIAQASTYRKGGA
ncbi:MAG: hypothetical protein AAFR22_25680 [Chloroflexota bacterium]